jgi:cell division transport system permease protein
MRAFKLLFSESIRSLGANLSTTIAATMTVLIGMFLLGLFIALGSWAQSFGDRQKEKLLVKVYFCTESTCAQPASQTQINAVRVKLTSAPLNSLVKDVTFVSKADALDRMRKLQPEIVANLPGNPLPDAFEVTALDGANVKAISRGLESPALPKGVEKINDGGDVSDRVVTVARVLSTAFAIATVVLLISSALLIANTIRLSIFSRRREIEVMKLVGATNWFVRGPFMLEGLICGVLGSLIAVLLLLIGKAVVLERVTTRFDAGAGVEAWSLTTISLIVILVGLTVGAIGSGITLRRFLQV